MSDKLQQTTIKAQAIKDEIKDIEKQRDEAKKKLDMLKLDLHMAEAEIQTEIKKEYGYSLKLKRE